MRHIRRILLSFAITVRGNEASLRSSTRWNNLPTIVEEFKCRVSGSFFKELLVGRKASRKESDLHLEIAWACKNAWTTRGFRQALRIQVAKFAINSLFLREGAQIIFIILIFSASLGAVK